VARLGAVLDRGELVAEREGLAAAWPARLAVVALDEGAHDDERAPAALAERLALWLDLSALPPRLAQGALPVSAAEIAEATARLPAVQAGPEVAEALCAVALQLGIASLRAPLLALALARRHAALRGSQRVEQEDAEVAARLVLAPRATRLPAPPEPEDAEQAAPPPEPPPPEAGAESTEVQDRPLEDRVLDAAVAALPPDLLARLKAAEAGRSRGADGKAGDWQRGSTRGRPAGVKRGEPRSGQRLDLIETLRAAAPWQRLRQASGASGPGPAVRVRPEDFHVRRYRQRRATTTVFVIDASGSAALHRLAEAKGAVELLLADCYVRRDQVAVLAFRGRGTELLLPPTRSLVRAKRALAGLPGGGGTPLASAVDAAAELARTVRRHGQTPVLVLLTDGRANVARDGSGGRAKAEADVAASARALAAEGFATLLVDTSPQPQASAAQLATALGATYLPLPHAGAQALSGAVMAHARGR
jgi:magnesium chelatase subunit D